MPQDADFEQSPDTDVSTLSESLAANLEDWFGARVKIDGNRVKREKKKHEKGNRR